MRTARRIPVDLEERWDPFDPPSRREWRQHAERLYRKWRLPPSVSADDVEQELLTFAWHFHERWDPDKGIPHRKWVFTGALNRTRSWIHAQRGALRRSCHAPSRTPSAFDPSDIDAFVADEAMQERVAAASEHADHIGLAVAGAVGDHRKVRLIECAAALRVTYDFEMAVDYLLRPDVRRRCRIDSDQQARAVLRRFARSVATDQSVAGEA